MHKALYRKWRPQVFDDVCGQEHITSVLKYEVQNGLLSHAYLFCGSRGVGKTTCAKILAKAVNCEHPVNGEPCGKCAACLAIDNGSAVDVVEMDAASNNGVDEIRDLRDEVVFAPAVLKYKVYIVDEVHMLSQSAFNALLKTLEEPPSYVIFILATTEQHKLPATIVSRCQRFEFKRISTDTLAARLNFIAKNEKIDIEPDASRLLSRLALGGMRDAISLLELCSGNNEKITVELVNETVGGTGREVTLKIAKAVAKKNYDDLFSEVNEVVRSSKSLTVFLQNMADFWRDMLVFKTTPDAA
ncbi:MAG: DNA polymerase III subunit gamma/tau, partial [Clostridia bacterium]|nr:DNA polymerase III subunit gamma/tau [Clostridia bacterium]